jgi:hypothetical protein
VNNRRPFVVLLTLAAASCATPGGVENRGLGWVCSAEASDGSVRASSFRRLGFQGDLRAGRTEFDLPLAGSLPARVLAEWDGSDLPELAKGRYRFRLSRPSVPAEPAQLQLVVGDLVVARGFWSPGLAEVSVRGRDIGPQLLAGAAAGLRLVTREGRSLGSVPVDRTGFDLAIQLSRQANADVLSKATDHRRQCQREQRIIPT